MNSIIHFEGKIRTIQSYASATPSLAKSVNSTQATPVTRAVFNGQEVLSITASSIKGSLRRASADIALMYQQDKTGKEKPLSLSAHKLNRIGGTKSKGDSDRVTPDDMKNINNEQLVVAIFGAGDPFLPGKLSVEPAYGEHNTPQVVDGVRSDDFLRDPELISILDDDAVTEFLANTSNVAEASKLKKDQKSVLRSFMMSGNASEKSMLEKKLKVIDKQLEKYSNVSTQLPLAGYEVIPAGESLSHKMRLRIKDNKEQLGFLLESLNYFASNPIMGGKKNNGCGEIAMEYTLFESGYNQSKKEIGSITVNPYEPIEVTGKYLLDAIAAFKEGCATHKYDFSEIK